MGRKDSFRNLVAFLPNNLASLFGFQKLQKAPRRIPVTRQQDGLLEYRVVLAARNVDDASRLARKIAWIDMRLRGDRYHRIAGNGVLQCLQNILAIDQPPRNGFPQPASLNERACRISVRGCAGISYSNETCLFVGQRAITIIDGAGIDDQAACCVGESGTCNRMPLVLETRRVIRVGGLAARNTSKGAPLTICA
jgi:hypothetical protein